MTFSIIIPMYNTQKTLERCVQSVLEQSYCDYEIIAVDDGSEDDTWNEALSLAKADARIRPFTMRHAGTGAARNLGMRYASGEYVLFLDADDYWVDGKLLERLSTAIEEHPSDVYMFHRVKVNAAGKELTRYTKPRFEPENCTLALGVIYHKLCEDGQPICTSTNKCVRKELLIENHIDFREDILGEDIDWALRLFSITGTICLLNTVAYAYLQHSEGSRSNSEGAPNDLALIVGDWCTRLQEGEIAHKDAAASQVAFQYGICMGSYNKLNAEKKKIMKDNVSILKYGLDRKSRMIYKLQRVLGFGITCMIVKTYILLRKTGKTD